jgi:hypothetical protein
MDDWRSTRFRTPLTPEDGEALVRVWDAVEPRLSVRRPRGRTVVTLALVFGTLVAGSTGAIAYAAAHPHHHRLSAQEAMADPKIMANQADIFRASGPLMRAIIRNDHTGIDEIVHDPDHGRILLYWHGQPPAAVLAVIRDERDVATIRVVQAPYSHRDKVGAIAKLMHSTPGELPPGVTLYQISNIPGGGLEVGYASVDGVSRAAATAALSLVAGLPVRLVRGGTVDFQPGLGTIGSPTP